MSSPESLEHAKAPHSSLTGRCFFKNAVIYRLPPDFKLSSAELEETLAKQPLSDCGPLETERSGWVMATSVGDRRVHTVNGQHLIALGIHTKIMPGSVVRQETQKRAQGRANELGFPVNRRQMRELKDKVTAELLAKALVRTTVTRAWIDSTNGWMVVEADGRARAEKLMTTLRDNLGSFAATLLDPEISPQQAMASWLRTGEAPLRFSLDSDLEMQSHDKGRATVRYARHQLDGQDVQLHLDSGKTVTRLGLTWNDRISFVVTHKLELKRISFLTLEERDQDDLETASIEEQIDADVLLMTADLAEVLSELTQALGVEQSVDAESAGTV